MPLKKSVILPLCMLVLVGLRAQPTVKLFFTQDSLALGEIVSLTLEVQHDPQTPFFFPDRRRDFLPLEWVESERLPTRKQGGVQIDQMVYQVRTFSLTNAQVVNLPYAYYDGQDTLIGVVQSAPIYLSERIPDLNDTLLYRVDPKHLQLGKENRLQGLLLILLALIVGVGLVYLLLRRPLYRLMQRRKLRQEWQQVRRQMLRLEKSADPEAAYNTLSKLWRHWLDPDETYGLPSMTSTELAGQLPRLPDLSAQDQATLLQAAQEADLVIYAGKHQPAEHTAELIQRLLAVMGKAYKRRDQLIRKPQA